MTPRLPANRPDPRAIGYWRLTSAIGWTILLALLGVGWYFVPRHWAWTTLWVAIAVCALVMIVIAPKIRYRVHRWEVDDAAVHTREGVFTIEERSAPLSRVQTVDTNQGALMRPFRLASVTVTTASSAGAVEIAGLDADFARELAARLTDTAAATREDAT